MCMCMVVVGFASEGKQHLNEQQLQNPESIIMLDLDKDAAYQAEKKAATIKEAAFLENGMQAKRDELKANPTPTGNDTNYRDCVNDDSGADAYGDTCSSWYDAYESPGSYGCSGGYDDDDFNAAEMCCACGGGSESGGCADGEFTCDDGACIPGSWECDVYWCDCAGCEDEADCGAPSCEDQGLWDCGDGQCINPGYVCDGSSEFCNAGWGPDCANGADEGLDACGYTDDCAAGCDDTQFDCGDGQCIYDTWECDGWSDCSNGADEADCAAPSCADQGLWDCGDGQCIYTSWECDGWSDCSNGADEADCAPASCEDQGLWDCGDGQCIPGGYVCDGSSEFCNAGWGPDCANGADEGLESCGYADECAPGVCEGCTYDWTAYGAECCDAAADAYGLSCAALEGNYGWDCDGCSCPLDEDGWDDLTCAEQGGMEDCVGTCVATSYLSWQGDGYCDDGAYGIVFTCCEYNFDNGDCGHAMGCDGVAADCGGASNDECGECGGDGSSCADCAGIPNGGNVLDCAGVCVDGDVAASYYGDGYCDDGTWGVDLTCQECDGGDCLQTSDPDAPCYSCDFTDCAGQCAVGYESWVGDGYCDDGAYGLYFDCDEFACDNGDCLDECGVCSGDGIADGACDCDGNVLDDCGECGGDNSSCADCAGVPYGDAVDDCADEDCIGGGWIADGWCDGTDQAYGADLTCYDCDGGDCMGICGCEDDTSCLDCCGVANGDNSSCGGSGDVNGGGTDVTDIVQIVDAILEVSSLDECSANEADATGDGSVNVLDVIAIVDIILSGQVGGCLDPEADNYNADADFDDGSCTYSCPDGTTDDCSGDGDCCPESWIGDGYCDDANQQYGCDLSCHDAETPDCEEDPGSEACTDCLYDFTPYGSECCDTAWDEYGINCATLEGNYNWDCSGCACPGDDDEASCEDLGQLDDCSGDGDCCSANWVGDGYCDGVDQAYGCDLSCFDNDGGDCEEDPPAGCSDDEFDCLGDGSECIPSGYVCDGSSEFCNATWGPDCSNGADEGLESCGYADECDAGCTDCAGNDCTDYESWATDSYCDDGTYGIDFHCPEWNCDGGGCGTEDLGDGTCGTPAPPSCADQGLWDCGDGECINPNYVCDGSSEFCNASWGPDCANGADEGLETCGYTDDCAAGCADDEFTCDDGTCIPGSWECDVYYCDCAGCEDEANCGGGECVNDDSTADSYGDTCSSWYDSYEYPGSSGCSGAYDDDDFSAAEQCCACQSSRAESSDLISMKEKSITKGDVAGYHKRTFAKKVELHSNDEVVTRAKETVIKSDVTPSVKGTANSDRFMTKSILKDASKHPSQILRNDAPLSRKATGFESKLEKANEAKLIQTAEGLTYEANGFVGFELTLLHGSDFEINLPNAGYIAKSNTVGNTTKVIVINNETNELFTANGDYEITNIVAGTVSGAEISNVDLVVTPKVFGISDAYPNPFNPTTSVELALPADGMVSVKVFNLMGQVVATLHEGQLGANTYSFTWDGVDAASGMYILQAEAAGNVDVQKIMLMK